MGLDVLCRGGFNGLRAGISNMTEDGRLSGRGWALERSWWREAQILTEFC